MFIEVNDKKIRVKSVITPDGISKGMMGRRFDDSFDGLLFFMNDDDNHCFWMKNCIIPLDIIYIKDDEISKIYEDCQPCREEDCDNYCGSGNFVLELRGGSCEKIGIFEGDKIKFVF